MGRENYKALIILLLVLASCKKDKPVTVSNTISSGANGVYIACEGVFQRGNSSLYFYKPAADSVFGDLYEAANNRMLGDVFQDMVHIGNDFFLSINSSYKIEVISYADYKSVATIRLAQQPRYILPVGNSKAYVSTIYSKQVYILNTTTFTIADSFLLPDNNPEGMCLIGNNAFICTWDTGSQNIYKVDVATNRVVQAIAVAGSAPHDVVVDKDHLLWILSGNRTLNKVSALTHIDPSTGDMLGSYTLPAIADAMKLTINPTHDTLYFIEADYYSTGTVNNGIFRMGIHEPAVPSVPFIPAQTFQYFYALGIDPATGNIYVGDPKGFQEKGAVLIYNTAAVLQKTFDVGYGPGKFYFN